MKKYLPHFLKQFLWRIFKSPERKYVGWHTLWIDFKGRIFLIFNLNKLQPITICVGVKNRSENLLNNLILSLNQCEHKAYITLSVLDAESTDIQNLEIAIRKHWQGQLIYTLAAQNFTRSKTFNQAILQAQTNIILACDADIYLSLDVVKKANRFATKKTTWFPIVWWQNQDKKTGRYYTEGTGIFAATKSNFIKSGMYDESITEWGKEDWLLYFNFYKNGIACFRTKEEKMIHCFHPSLKPKDFKPLF